MGSSRFETGKVAETGRNRDIYLEPFRSLRTSASNMYSPASGLFCSSVVVVCGGVGIAIPLQPLKVGKEGSDLYILSLARLD